VRLWRISDFADLTGLGGVLVSGRWHVGGQWIVYLADHPASALLEVLTRLDVDAADLPSSFQLLAIDAPDEIPFERIDGDRLSLDWRANLSETQDHGVRWLSRNATALLRVPSAIVPYAWNWLLNPQHEDARKVSVVEVTRAPFDPRLLT
jgi:RES domain-containing protein